MDLTAVFIPFHLVFQRRAKAGQRNKMSKEEWDTLSTNGILHGDEGHWTSSVWCGRVWAHGKVTTQLTVLQFALYWYLCPLYYLVLRVSTFCTLPGSCVPWSEVVFFLPALCLPTSLPSLFYFFQTSFFLIRICFYFSPLFAATRQFPILLLIAPAAQLLGVWNNIHTRQRRRWTGDLTSAVGTAWGQLLSSNGKHQHLMKEFLGLVFPRSKCKRSPLHPEIIFMYVCVYMYTRTQK